MAINGNQWHLAEQVAGGTVQAAMEAMAIVTEAGAKVAAGAGTRTASGGEVSHLELGSPGASVGVVAHLNETHRVIPKRAHRAILRRMGYAAFSGGTDGAVNAGGEL